MGDYVVTGAAGFIGSRLAQRLCAEGHRVVGVDALRGTTTPALAAARLEPLASEAGFELVELDLVSPGLEHVLTRVRPDAVFHLAARTGARDPDTTLLVRDCIEATACLIEAAVRSGVTEIVYSSSSSVYGDEGTRGPCREDAQVTPLSAYGEAKRAAELLVLAAPMRSTAVRLFTVYGPGQRPDMAFARFIDAALGGGSAPQYQPSSAARDFTYVDDAVEGLVLAHAQGVSPVYNVSGGRVVTLDEAFRLVEELTGSTLTVHPEAAPPEPPTTRADLRLAGSELGYTPRIDLRSGLTSQVAAAASVASVI